MSASPSPSPSSAAHGRWEPVIGLEVHCQLKTATKLFCACRNAFGEPPNALTCPVCTGQPGALPVLNREALALAVRVALALETDVAAESRFDRKNYFYCDLPKGYQISQFARPYCEGGGITLNSGKRVRLTRIHMEEDAGKAIHDRGDATLVDLNRACVPLIESVTEADLSSADEAVEYLTSLKEILQYVGASDCDMEKGSLRCDVNISVRRPGEDLRTRVELKNLNSFSNVKAAIEHEIARQIEAYESEDPGRFPVLETRLFDATTGTTRAMRSKEDADDYRYFPEPDLPPVTVGAELIERERSFIPELPAARRARYVHDHGLSAYDAGVLCASRAVADFFEQTVAAGAAPKDAANWIANEMAAIVSDPANQHEGIDSLPVKPRDLADMIRLISGGEISNSAGRKVLRAMVETGKDARTLASELGLEAVRDTAVIEEWVREAMVGREQVVADLRAGKEKALGALVGPVMAASRGSADPALVRETILRIVNGEA